MLRYVLSRHNKKSRDGEYWQVIKDTHYSWNIPLAMNKEIPSPTRIKREGKSFAYAGPPFTGGQKAGSHQKARMANMTSTRTFTGFNKKAKKNGNVPPFAQRFDTTRFRPPYKDLYGHTIGRVEMLEMCKQGCAFCGDDTMEWLEFIQIMGPYRGPKVTPFMCESCYQDVDAYDTLEYVL